MVIFMTLLKNAGTRCSGPYGWSLLGCHMPSSCHPVFLPHLMQCEDFSGCCLLLVNPYSLLPPGHQAPVPGLWLELPSPAPVCSPPLLASLSPDWANPLPKYSSVVHFSWVSPFHTCCFSCVLPPHAREPPV